MRILHTVVTPVVVIVTLAVVVVRLSCNVNAVAPVAIVLRVVVANRPIVKAVAKAVAVPVAAINFGIFAPGKYHKIHYA